METGQSFVLSRSGNGEIRMTPERWLHVRSIFDAVVECAPGARAAFIRKRCGDDTDLQNEVESLLECDAPTGPLLDNPLMETATDVSQFADLGASSPLHDDSFGFYETSRLLGEGGMGTVYLAKQIYPIRREVALKVVKF